MYKNYGQLLLNACNKGLVLKNPPLRANSLVSNNKTNSIYS